MIFANGDGGGLGYQNTETRGMRASVIFSSVKVDEVYSGNIILYKPAGKDSGGGRPSETPWGLRRMWPLIIFRMERTKNWKRTVWSTEKTFLSNFESKSRP